MADWSDRVDALLYDGESVESEFLAGTATVIVTSHRVLAFTPTIDGPEYAAVDRPNVVDVERRSISDRSLWRPAAKATAIAVPFLALGAVLDPEAWLPRPDVSGTGAGGGAVETVDAMLGLFYGVDTAMLVVGTALVVVALALVGVQLASREQFVVLSVAGDETDVRMPDALGEGELAALREAIAPPPPSEPEPATVARSE